MCNLINGCSFGLDYSHVATFLGFLDGRPITVSSCPFGQPHFRMMGGMVMSMQYVQECTPLVTVVLTDIHAHEYKTSVCYKLEP